MTSAQIASMVSDLGSNQHCNVAVSGAPCMPQYVLHNVKWKNTNKGMKWVQFEAVMGGDDLPASLFPSGYVSLVSSELTYLLGAPDNPCVLSRSLGS